MMNREITGKHVLAVFVAAFGVIIAVNGVLAYSAVRTFPGLEVSNSYVASQEFNERKAEQVALGWNARAAHKGGVLSLSITDQSGQPVQPARLDAVLGRATHVKDDQTLSFTFDGRAFVSPVELADGNWNIRMTALSDDGARFQQRLVLIVN